MLSSLLLVVQERLKDSTMPLGIVSDKDFEKEIVNTGVVVGNKNKGRGEGNKEVPKEIKKFIIEENLRGSSSRELQQLTGASSSSISAYVNGANSTASYNKPDSVLVTHKNSVVDKITRKARKILISSMNEITPDKLQKAKVTEVAMVARSMAGIIKDMEPEVIEQKNDNRVQFIMFAPQMKTERHYDAIDVSALDVE